MHIFKGINMLAGGVDTRHHKTVNNNDMARKMSQNK